MDCRSTRRLLEHRSNREALPSPSVERHLRACRDCERWARETVRLDELLTAAVQPRQPRPGFEDRLAHRLQRPKPVTPAARLLRSPTPWVFAAGLCAGLLLQHLGNRKAPSLRLDSQVPLGAGAIVGRLASGSESVEISNPGSAVPMAPSLGSPLTPNSTVWVARAGTAEVILPRGGRLRLGERAVVRFQQNGLVLYRGAARLSVVRGAEPFTVELPNGYLVAEQATFDVAVSQTRKTSVSLKEGVVWLGNRTESIAVTAGESATLGPRAAPTVTG